MTYRFLVLCLAFLLTACSHAPVNWPGVGGDESRLVTDTLAYAYRVSNLGAEEQRRELASAQQSFNRERSLANRLRLGTLLSLPSLDAEGRAAAVLEPVAGNGGPAHHYAALLLGQVNDRLREQRRGQQLKEQVEGLKAIERQLIERGKAGL